MDEVIQYSFYGETNQAFYCRDPEVMLAGPADTGKTLMWLTRLHLLALMYKNASIVICRKQLTDVYSTVLQTYQREVAADAIENGIVQVYGGERPSFFHYQPTGSRIWVAGLDKPGKVLSGQHDIVLVNQAEEAALADWQTLITRTTGRAGNIPYNQTIGDCNPATPTHWIKKRQREGLLTFYESSHRDNPELFDPETGKITPGGKQRLGQLARTTGSIRKRLYLGVWAPPEGAIYEIFDEERHVVKAFPIPQHWGRIIGVDPIGEQTAAVWMAFDPESRVLNVYREYAVPFGVATAEHARRVLELSKGETARIIGMVVGQPAERQSRADWAAASRTIPVLKPPYGDVWVGIDKIVELLSDFKLVIHDTCPGIISEIGEYHRKMGRDGIPTEQIYQKERFHLLDCARYGIAYLTGPREETRVGYESVAIRTY